MNDTVDDVTTEKKKPVRVTARRKRVNKRVTMTDIARIAGCSQATVSCTSTHPVQTGKSCTG